MVFGLSLSWVSASATFSFVWFTQLRGLYTSCSFFSNFFLASPLSCFCACVWLVFCQSASNSRCKFLTLVFLFLRFISDPFVLFSSAILFFLVISWRLIFCLCCSIWHVFFFFSFWVLLLFAKGVVYLLAWTLWDDFHVLVNFLTFSSCGFHHYFHVHVPVSWLFLCWIGIWVVENMPFV